jgi:hypothetical protein
MLYQAFDYLRYKLAFWLWCELPMRDGVISRIRLASERIWRGYLERNP